MSRSGKPPAVVSLRGGLKSRRVLDDSAAAALEAKAEIDGGGLPTEIAPSAFEAAPAVSLPPVIERSPAPDEDDLGPDSAEPEGVPATGRKQGTIRRPYQRKDGVVTRVIQYHLPISLARKVREVAASRDLTASALVTEILNKHFDGN